MKARKESMRRASALLVLLLLIIGGTGSRAENGSETPGAGENQITVCVIDSGCSDPEISGWNFMENTADISDSQGHGTEIVSIIKEGAANARIIMLKCFDSQINPENNCVAAAVRAAVDQYHADIIHMSWTLNEENESLHQAVIYAEKHGAVPVASTGNLSLETGLDAKTYPAVWEEVIGVGGVDITDDGPKSSLWYLGGEALYVCARADYEEKRGTSYAAARVSGRIAAFLETQKEKRTEASCLETAGDKTGTAVREMLRAEAEDLGEEGYDMQYGWGYINCERISDSADDTE